jgi:hypothetical protein
MTNKYKLVPIEPTEEMFKADLITAALWRDDVDKTFREVWTICYKAMLEAAPPADVEPVAIYQVALNGLWFDTTIDDYVKNKGIKRTVYAQPPADVKPVADSWVSYTGAWQDSQVLEEGVETGNPVFIAGISHSAWGHVIQCHGNDEQEATELRDLVFNALSTQPPADKDAERIEQLEDCLDKIRSWCKAYPTTIFTEPNWDEVQEKLGKNLLCQVSGSNMRHVTTGIQKIIDATMGEAMGEV